VAAEAERDKLVAARDDANERRQKDSHELRLELHELRSRFETTEEMLADARRSLAVRAEEAAVAEARLLEATLARNEAEKKLERLGGQRRLAGTDPKTRVRGRESGGPLQGPVRHAGDG
jgi:septal ring factor EnvC (AmiA/AmiB activator)